MQHTGKTNVLRNMDVSLQKSSIKVIMNSGTQCHLMCIYGEPHGGILHECKKKKVKLSL
jgi:hypothetical protein